MPERLIDADALLDDMQFHLDSTYMSVCISVEECEARRREIKNCIDTIKEATPVDAVRVVRCKDCVWFEPKHILHNDGTVTYVTEDAENVTSDVGINCQATCRRYSYIKNWFVSDSGNDYCSRGEKMDGEKGGGE